MNPVYVFYKSYLPYRNLVTGFLLVLHKETRVFPTTNCSQLYLPCSHEMASLHDKKCKDCKAFMAALDPHSTCHRCVKSRDLVLCSSDSRCSKCADMSPSDFASLLASWQTTPKRHHKKEKDARPDKDAIATGAKPLSSPPAKKVKKSVDTPLVPSPLVSRPLSLSLPN